jgi:hypothetical protein
MPSPSIIKAREDSSELEEIIIKPFSSSKYKQFICYSITVLIILLFLKPNFIMVYDTPFSEPKISYAKVILWEFLFCLPFWLYQN